MIETIIPTRNAPEILWLTLVHYYAHAHDPALVRQVTLLDNCSSASGMTEVLGYAQRWGARVVRHERNVGVWASVNRGLVLARSPWVFVLTSDVLLGPGAVNLLAQTLQQTSDELVFVGPNVADTLQACSALAELPAQISVSTARYNGACFLLRWDVLREKVGWFDPQFAVCYGDTDYAERIVLARLNYGVTLELGCVHLDKKSRQADHTAEEDTEVEMRDAERFYEKWASFPDVLTRHPRITRQAYLAMKNPYWGKNL